MICFLGQPLGPTCYRPPPRLHQELVEGDERRACYDVDRADQDRLPHLRSSGFLPTGPSTIHIGQRPKMAQVIPTITSKCPVRSVMWSRTLPKNSHRPSHHLTLYPNASPPSSGGNLASSRHHERWQGQSCTGLSSQLAYRRVLLPIRISQVPAQRALDLRYLSQLLKPKALFLRRGVRSPVQLEPRGDGRKAIGLRGPSRTSLGAAHPSCFTHLGHTSQQG